MEDLAGTLTISVASVVSSDPSILASLSIECDTGIIEPQEHQRLAKRLQVCEPCENSTPVQNLLNPKKSESAIMLKFDESILEVEFRFFLGDGFVASKKIGIPHHKLGKQCVAEDTADFDIEIEDENG